MIKQQNEMKRGIEQRKLRLNEHYCITYKLSKTRREQNDSWFLILVNQRKKGNFIKKIEIRFLKI